MISHLCPAMAGLRRRKPSANLKSSAGILPVHPIVYTGKMPVLMLIGETLKTRFHHGPHPPDKKGAEPDEEIERYFHIR